jgi:hypothetical protein
MHAVRHLTSATNTSAPGRTVVTARAWRFAGSLILRAGLLASPASAATLTFTGSGGVVPTNTSATFDITIADAGIIAASGNNVTLTLNDIFHYDLGGLTMTLEHVGFGATRTAFARVSEASGDPCTSDFDGSYSFNSGAATTLSSACGATRMPSGTYATTADDDVTNSGLSNSWNGQSMAGSGVSPS